jgi:hypothetical protein
MGCSIDRRDVLSMLIICVHEFHKKKNFSEKKVKVQDLALYMSVTV